MGETRPEDFGSTCGGSRWFNREPVIKTTPMRAVWAVWPCPIEGCDGEMKYAGWTWPTGDPGYHHECTKCRFTAAIKGKCYPMIDYVPDSGDR